MRMLKAVLGAVLVSLVVAAPSLAQPVRIAFVDTGNTGRSITAETIARYYAVSHSLDARFISRGVDVNPYETKVEMNAQILWLEKGVDLSDHVAAQVTPQDVKRSTLILTLTAKHKAILLETFKEAAGKTFTLSEYVGKDGRDIEDPWGKPMDAYVHMFADLNALVPAALEKAITEAGQKRAP